MKKEVSGVSLGAPDGGYAWFILLACFTVFGLTFGVIKSFGVFYVEIHHHFDTTATTASWVTSIAVATVHVGGLGYALAWTPTVTMVGLYFDRKRPMANALSSAGECVLTFVFTPLSQWLIDCYSWRGAMLILGGLQFNLCVCGALLRPLENSRDFNRPKEVKVDEEENMLQNHSHGVGRKLFKIKSKIIPFVDYTLIANAKFMVYSMFGVFAALGFFAPALFLVPFARSRGVEEYQSAALMSISSALDLIGRVAFGWVANLRIIKTLHQLIITVTLLSVVLLFCPLASSFAELTVFSGAFGLVFGATVAVHITVLAEVVGVHRLGSALGFFMLIRSCGGLLGAPIAGFFIDQMGNYGAGFLMAGAAIITSVLFLILLEMMNRKGQRSGANGKCKYKGEIVQGQKSEEETEIA
ncbi:monocarboxylate transporter 12 isoform X2 [Eucyclogobius newberryi]|uniref:monocarboxylate transporter 12 isoform X2 n=1 Tax=Eucyclogobius newberryi TaxID=166745 RepID=UPI003B5AA8F0